MRSVALLGVVVSAFFLPFALSLIAALFYALFYRAYELIIVGMFIDAQFGTTAPFSFLYTVSYGGMVLSIELVKPWFSFYTNERDS